MDRQQLVVVHRRGEIEPLDINALDIAAMARGAFASRLVHQYPAHGFGGGGEAMRTISPWLAAIAEAQPGFMNQGGRLQSLAWRFASHPLRRQPTQFIVHER